MSILNYIAHLRSCNTQQDYSRLEEAIHFINEQDQEAAYAELEEKKNTCTCGVNEAMIGFAKAWYVRGQMDGRPSVFVVSEEPLEIRFDKDYASTFSKI